MTPKEKAVELYEKYFYMIHSNIDSNFSDSLALNCALVAINEIIKSNPMMEKYPISYSSVMYWKEVKQEINSF